MIRDDTFREAIEVFDEIQSSVQENRNQCYEDRRFCFLPGAQWENRIGRHFANKPRLEANKTSISVLGILDDYRNNRISAKFHSDNLDAGKAVDEFADNCSEMYRSVERERSAVEAYDNAFCESVAGGIGAWRLVTSYDNDLEELSMGREPQKISIVPIYEADISVFFDTGSMLADKSDATFGFLVTPISRRKYKKLYGDDVSSWDYSTINNSHSHFDWVTPDLVNVAEFFKVEEGSEDFALIERIDGAREIFRKEELENEDISVLVAEGAKVVREFSKKRKTVRKYILSGGGILEDLGKIAGDSIPIVTVYGRRNIIGGVEICSGHARNARDMQMLKNMQLSKLAEISAASASQKPIFFPEQVAGHEMLWAEDNLKNYPYLLINPMVGADGSTALSGPAGNSSPPSIPPALGALLKTTEADIADLLGETRDGEKVVSNVAQGTLELMQARIDRKSVNYIANFGNAVKRSAEIWAGIARDIYVSPGQKVASINSAGKSGRVEILKPELQGDKIQYRNDFKKSSFKVTVSVGPSSESRRSSLIRQLTGLLGGVGDLATKNILVSVILANLEGEGLADIRNYFRKDLLRQGVLEPNEDEKKELDMEAASQQPTQESVFMEHAIEVEKAKSEKIKADAVKSGAQAEKTMAEVAEIVRELTPK